MTNTVRAAALSYYILDGMLLHWTLASVVPAWSISQDFDFFTTGANYSTLHGTSTVSYTRPPGDDAAYINGVRILQSNIPITNGVLHVIDGPLHLSSVDQADGAAIPATTASATPVTSLTTLSGPTTRSSAAIATTTSLVAAASNSAAVTTAARVADAHTSTAVAWAMVGAWAGAVALLT